VLGLGPWAAAFPPRPVGFSGDSEGIYLVVRSAMAVLAVLIRIVLLLVGLALAFGAILSLYGFCVCVAQPNFRQAKFWFGNMAAASVFSYLMYQSATHLELLLPWIFDDYDVLRLVMPKPLTERKAIKEAEREGKPLASYACRLRTLSVATAEKICAEGPSRWADCGPCRMTWRRCSQRVRTFSWFPNSTRFPQRPGLFWNAIH